MPSGRLYSPYHLLREPETTIDISQLFAAVFVVASHNLKITQKFHISRMFFLQGIFWGKGTSKHFSLSQWTLKKKQFERLIFPTKYEIPKKLKPFSQDGQVRLFRFRPVFFGKWPDSWLKKSILWILWIQLWVGGSSKAMNHLPQEWARWIIWDACYANAKVFHHGYYHHHLFTNWCEDFGLGFLF